MDHETHSRIRTFAAEAQAAIRRPEPPEPADISGDDDGRPWRLRLQVASATVVAMACLVLALWPQPPVSTTAPAPERARHVTVERIPSADRAAWPGGLTGALSAMVDTFELLPWHLSTLLADEMLPADPRVEDDDGSRGDSHPLRTVRERMGPGK